MCRTSRRSYLISPSPCCVFAVHSIMVRITNMTQNHQLTHTAVIKTKPIQAALMLSYPMPHIDAASPSSIPITATNITVFQCIFIVKYLLGFRVEKSCYIISTTVLTFSPSVINAQGSSSTESSSFPMTGTPWRSSRSRRTGSPSCSNT